MELLKALTDPLLLIVINSLSNGEKCVCDLIEETGFAQSKISFHLKALKDVALISGRQSGRWVSYTIEVGFCMP